MAAADTNTAAWDDTAAIANSWNQVVSDYKIFHTVRARGGTVDDLPPLVTESGEERLETNAKPETTRNSAGGSSQEAAAATAAAATRHDSSGDDPTRAAHDTLTSDHEQATAGTKGQAFPGAGADMVAFIPPSFFCMVREVTDNPPPVPNLIAPQAVLDGADENLKKLLMSWYYAGYYTGRYEGEQQALRRQEEEEQQGHQEHFEEADESRDDANEAQP
ncbi:Survival motor neuron [Niveomyces insectorum RCEF 264]|uniref:Survival motor neuron n=1 Tax=Niveomyces insectorum RCEF 264 TaxID=1081102 RepID=A0A167YM62_9HYPO|nr:Survival motor neuron [Niveomyces insectorum RCEF 264]